MQSLAHGVPIVETMSNFDKLKLDLDVRIDGDSVRWILCIF